MSMTVPIYGFGSGGASLNFKVVAGTKPASAKENTIWVNTSKINNYYFSVAQPENMADYDVWFQTGTFSHISFNALKKNSVRVYPISVKQRISGALVEKTAQIYQGGMWVEWIVYLYNSGDEYTSLTGGWAQPEISYNVGGNLTRPNSGAISRGSDSITLTAGAQTLSLIVTTNEISFGSAAKIVFEGVSSSVDSNEFGIVRAKTGELSAIRVARKSLDASNTTYELEIPSGLSSGYVYVMANGGNRTVTVNKVWLK